MNEQIAERLLSDLEARRQLGHQLRDPLNGARLHLAYARKLLEDVALPDDAAEALQTVDLEIDRAAKLISNLVSSEPAAPSPAKVSVRSLCSRVVQMMAQQPAPNCSVELLTSPDADTLELELDRSRIEKVLLDLLHRATESALRSGGKVLLSARRDGNSALVDVQHREGNIDLLRDGMSFSNAKEDAELQTAFKVVAEHGGALEIGGGFERTTFHLRLPLRAEDSSLEEATE